MLFHSYIRASKLICKHESLLILGFLDSEVSVYISLKVFAYPFGAYTKGTIRTLKNNGIDYQIYDIGINNFKTLDKNFIKRINIPCEMTGKEIIDCINEY